MAEMGVIIKVPVIRAILHVVARSIVIIIISGVEKRSAGTCLVVRSRRVSKVSISGVRCNSSLGRGAIPVSITRLATRPSLLRGPVLGTAVFTTLRTSR
jgi:hypothetical protein